ncbi:MAG: putative peptidoglycan glycosyltransferase FtsW, partial [Verrucomicrobia bacterium]|nr:putative peptidoglycan glycosyltransferase FtsW [Verrucomicrobiota bacterium]
LVGLGITMLASTSFFTKEGGGEEYVTVWKQVLWMGVAFVACIVTALLDFNLWYRWRWHLFGLAVFGLLLCYESHLAALAGYKPLIAAKVNGASRWIGIGSFRVQPSEFAKIILIIAMAGWFATHEALERTLKYGLILPGAVLGLIVAMIGGEVDLGNATVAALVGAGIMFVAGTRFRYLAIIFGTGMAALVMGIFLAPNRFERVMAITHLEKVKDGIGLQQWVSWLAFGSGGMNGRGLGEGRMKLSYLPEAHTDFIFPMVGEELGLWGVLATVAAFIVLLFAGMCISSYAPSRFGKLLGFGLTFLLSLEALLNMGVTTALLPNKGLPLPFVSYGGSSLLAAMVAVGILINIHRQGVHLSWDQLPVIRRKRRWTPEL